MSSRYGNLVAMCAAAIGTQPGPLRRSALKNENETVGQRPCLLPMPPAFDARENLLPSLLTSPTCSYVLLRRYHGILQMDGIRVCRRSFRPAHRGGSTSGLTRWISCARGSGSARSSWISTPCKFSFTKFQLLDFVNLEASAQKWREARRCHREVSRSLC